MIQKIFVALFGRRPESFEDRAKNMWILINNNKQKNDLATSKKLETTNAN